MKPQRDQYGMTPGYKPHLLGDACKRNKKRIEKVILRHIKTEGLNDTVDTLPSNTMIDIEESISNSITDDRFDKYTEGCKQLAEALRLVGIEMAKAISPLVEHFKELSGVYNWQEEIANY
jgi:hypothetical protein